MDKHEMSETDYLRAMFFSSDEDFAAVAAAKRRRPRGTRRAQQLRAEIKALRSIVRGFTVLQVIGPHATIAAVRYVNGRYAKAFGRSSLLSGY